MLPDVCLAASITLMSGYSMPGCLCYLAQLPDVCLADCYLVELPDVCLAAYVTLLRWLQYSMSCCLCYLAGLPDVCLAVSPNLLSWLLYVWLSLFPCWAVYCMSGCHCYLVELAYVCLAVFYLVDLADVSWLLSCWAGWCGLAVFYLVELVDVCLAVTLLSSLIYVWLSVILLSWLIYAWLSGTLLSWLIYAWLSVTLLSLLIYAWLSVTLLSWLIYAWLSVTLLSWLIYAWLSVLHWSEMLPRSGVRKPPTTSKIFGSSSIKSWKNCIQKYFSLKVLLIFFSNLVRALPLDESEKKAMTPYQKNL